MDTDLSRRARLAARAADELADLDVELVRGVAGCIPFLVALPTDPMGYVFERLRTRHPTGANVVTTVRDHLAVVAFTPARDDSERASASDPLQICPVHPDTHVAMFVTYLAETGGVVTCREVVPGYAMSLVREPEQLFA